MQKRGCGACASYKKAQLSLEYMTVTGIFLVLMLPVIYFAISEINNQVSLSQADEAVRLLKETADKTYALGPGTRLFTNINLPGNVEAIVFDGKEIIMNISVFGGTSQITRTTIANVSGVLSTRKGGYKIQFETLATGIVFIGTNDTTAPQVISTSPSGTTNSNMPTLGATTDEEATCKYCNTTSATVVCDALTNYTTMDQNFTGATTTHSASSGLLLDNTYTYYVRCKDTTDNTMNTSATLSFIVDTTPPTISSIKNHTIGNSSVKINWTTNEAASSIVRYSNTTALENTATDSVLVTLRQINITSLLNGTLYYYKVESCDAVNNCINSSLLNFTTSAFSVDLTPPAISNVRNGTITNTTTEIMWDTDENANGTVYYAQNLSLTSTAHNTSFSTARIINLTGLRNATLYYYNVTSCDSSGNCAEQSGVYNFTTLQNPDTKVPNITNIADTPDPVRRRAQINFTANATDDGGIAIVYLQILGVNYTMNNGTTDIYYYDTFNTNLTVGTYNYTIFAMDNSNNTATSAIYTFSISRSAMLAYFDPNEATVPKYRVWNVTNWSAQSTFNDNGGTANDWYVLASSPINDEKILGTQDDALDVHVQVWNGTAWSIVTNITTSVSDATYRRGYDIAYEQLSGRAIAVYRSQNNLTVPSYRIWNRTGWTAEARAASIGTGNINWVRLVSKPSSNEMILATMDANLDVYAQVWNGTEWVSSTALETATEDVAYQSFDIAYEQQSGRGIVAWIDGSSTRPDYNIWNGTAWGSISQASASTSNRLLWLRLASSRTTNTIVLGTLDFSDDLSAQIWNGTTWLTAQTISTDVNSHITRNFDVVFENNTGRAFIAYNDKNVQNPGYAIWNNTWQTGLNATGTGGLFNWIILEPDMDTNNLFLIGSDTSSAAKPFKIQQWNGTAWLNLFNVSPTTATAGMSFAVSFDKD